MGGYGSGRRWSLSQTMKIEDARVLDIAALAHAGYLHLGAHVSGGWKWWIENSSETTSSVSLEINLATGQHSYRVRYTLTANGEQIQVGGALLRTEPNNGGTRWWFACPRCRRRVRKLYLASTPVFACRNCHHLRYASQSENQADRLLRRANKLYRRGGSTTNGTTFTPKPKGMHWRTFNRLMDEAEDAINRSLCAQPFVKRWIPHLQDTAS